MYVPSTKTIISSYDAFFNESFSNTLAYISQTYAEAMVMRPAMAYTPYDTSSREKMAI